ncbi:hypothetical protein SCHPADRAFT_971393 [Schizopora paradoxa]|uniref:Pericentrin/AKAP-450 centrosomal targeting domain-containing protein n=1 Tax=Schizopora paradoxa TaxID=27342 RepID=A0A0H2RM63_9AGAM|nr:hypothetical protein SCHPADRAFT_971393 [Schizopora paradoxa]
MENTNLTTALRGQDDAEVLQERLAANGLLIDRLRAERSELTSERFQLQEQLAEASKHANKLDSEQVKLQASYNGRRKQIDIQAAEMEDLRRTLSSQGTLLDKAVADRNRAEFNSREVQAVIRGLEADLKRVQKDADTFGEDLKRLRQQKDEMEARHDEERTQYERKAKQSRSQIRLLRDQLESQNHLQVTNVDPYLRRSIGDLKSIHKKECKGLFVQIRYLKAKFTREAALRADLGYQKQYLLVVLSRLEKSEKRVLATLAEIGSPTQEPRKPRTLRIYGMLVVFLLRTRRASEVWREQRSSKEAVAKALEQVRKRREKPTS